MIRADYLIDLGQLGSGVVRIRADFSGLPRGAELRLPARLAKIGVKVRGLRAVNASGKTLGLRISEEKIYAPDVSFSLVYSLSISFMECAGTDKEIELLYPFLNSRELFLGSGALVYPESLRVPAPRLRASLRLSGLPSGWRMFSNMSEGSVSQAALDSFFAYFSKRRMSSHACHGLAGRTDFSLLVAKGKTIPLTRAEVWQCTDRVMRTLEKNLAAYRGFRKLNILLLQCPADFERLAGGRTFAAGENVAGGIVIYTPKSSDYIDS